jgi:hypothetical protein
MLVQGQPGAPSYVNTLISLAQSRTATSPLIGRAGPATLGADGPRGPRLEESQ